MNFYNSQRGQSLMEIVFAIAIFTVGVITIGYLIITALASLHTATLATQARLLAREGLEAVDSIRDGGFDLLSAGTYGLILDQGLWTLASSSDVHGKFSRTITTEDIDINTKEVTSRVSWRVFGVREKTISYTKRFSNWQQTGGEAGTLVVSTENAMRIASSTILTGVSLQNSSDTSITLTKMTVIWDTPPLLERITMNGFDIFTASTSAPKASGTEINIDDYTLEAYSGEHFIDTITFDGAVGGSNFVMRFTLADGSVRSVYITP